MCNLIENIVARLSKLGLSFSQKEDQRTRTATTNGSANFDAVIKAIENEIMKINGENIIVRGENGSIFDMKEKEAEIKKAFYVECYCYDCLSAYFIRVWHEKALFMEKEWISVDIDEIKQSLWFSDE